MIKSEDLTTNLAVSNINDNHKEEIQNINKAKEQYSLSIFKLAKKILFIMLITTFVVTFFPVPSWFIVLIATAIPMTSILFVLFLLRIRSAALIIKLIVKEDVQFNTEEDQAVKHYYEDRKRIAKDELKLVGTLVLLVFIGIIVAGISNGINSIIYN